MPTFTVDPGSRLIRKPQQALSEELAGEGRRAACRVESRIELDVVHRDDVELAADEPHVRNELRVAEPARLLRARPRKLGRIEDVHVDREVDGGRLFDCWIVGLLD